MFCVSSWHTCLLLYLSVFLCGPFTIFLTGQKYIIILAFPCPFPGFSLFCPLNFHFACPFLFASPYFFFASVCVLVLTFPFSAFLVFVVFAIALNAIFRFAFDSFLSFAFLLHFLLSHFCLLESNISNHFNTRHIKQLRLRPFTLTSVVQMKAPGSEHAANFRQVPVIAPAIAKLGSACAVPVYLDL